jgi:hypothetical protein
MAAELAPIAGGRCLSCLRNMSGDPGDSHGTEAPAGPGVPLGTRYPGGWPFARVVDDHSDGDQI